MAELSYWRVLLRNCRGIPNPEILRELAPGLAVIPTDERPRDLVAGFEAPGHDAAAYVAESLRLCCGADSAAFVVPRESEKE